MVTSRAGPFSGRQIALGKRSVSRSRLANTRITLFRLQLADRILENSL